MKITGAIGSTITYKAWTRLASETTLPSFDPNPTNDSSTLLVTITAVAAVPALSPLALGALVVMLAVAALWVQRIT